MKKTLVRMKNGNTWQKRKILAIFLTFMAIIAITLCSAYLNARELEKQLNQNLEDVANQNSEILKTKISEKYNLLNSLGKELQGVTRDEIDEKLGYYTSFLDEMDLKRFAYCFADGTAYSTDGDQKNLVYREFYKAGMDGKCSLTGVLTDAIGEEHAKVNVMSIPIFDEAGNPQGVFGLTYDTEDFNKFLQIESFEGEGYSCILDGNGDVMAVTDGKGIELAQNFFGDVLDKDERNTEPVKALKAQIENGTAGGGSFYITEKNYYYCVPVSMMDDSFTWYVVTSVSSELFHSRVHPVIHNQYATSFLVVLLVSIGFLVLIFYIKEQYWESVRVAYENPVTKGANYRKFAVDIAKRNRDGYLIALYIENFNNVIISDGEEGARKIVKDVWKVISDSLETDELAAYDRDEKFLIFLIAENDEALALRMNTISEQISAVTKSSKLLGLHAYYGIYATPVEESFESAYGKAKTAGQYVMINPESKYVFYHKLDIMKSQRETVLEERFETALEDHEFEVWYQPKYSAQDASVVGSEALVRWREKDGSLVSPGVFIPLFERNGMIRKLDEYMFRMVCAWQKKRLEEGRKMYPVSVNISRASFYREDVVERYTEIMQEYGMNPEYVQIEITESVLGGRTDVESFLRAFREKGIKILMDDFGTGYSSLSMLSKSCFDVLKLDKSLIDQIGNKDGDILVGHIIQMGQQMGLRITAEGVEKEEQIAFLKDKKCDDIQGFYYSRPLPQAEYEELLDRL